MLYLENEEIQITEDAMTFAEVKDLYNKDRRNQSKPYFKKCITYIYWAYKKDGEFKQLLPSKRRNKAAEIAGVDKEEMDNDKSIKAFVKLYLELQSTPSEHLLYAAEKRVEETIDWLNSIPIKKVEKRKIQVYYNVPENDEKQSQYIMVETEIDNSDEVKKGMLMANMLADQLETLKKKIIKENTQQKSQGRLFDTMKGSK
jgi:hypothetical protein